MLRLLGIGKTFSARGVEVVALRDVDLQIKPAAMTAVLGPSGSGKSTLLRVIAGFERPDAGELRLGDRLLAGRGVFVRPERRGVGMVSQDGALFPHLDVAGNIGFGLVGVVADRLSPRRRKARAARIEQLLDMVGLGGYQRRRVDELSGGQQQRVALARALAPRPQIVLLDEPFSAIDAALRAELSVEVRDLLRGLGVTAVLVTHDQHEALSLADEVVVMREGRVVQIGTPRQVYERPADLDTARFVGEAVVLDGKVLSCADGHCRVDCALGELSAASTARTTVGGACRVLIRPEALTVTDSGVCAQVVSSEYYGHDAMTTLRLGPGGSGPTVRLRSAEPVAAADGKPVRLGVVGPVLCVPDS